MVARRICCIDVSLAARIIGAYTMSTSVLMINMLVSNFFSKSDDEDFFKVAKNWAILGFNWMQAFRYMHLQNKVQTAMVSFLTYISLFLLAGAYLALASFTRRHKYAVPWMYLQIISITDQTMALSNHIIQQQQNATLARSMTCSIYLISSIYLWMIVHAARKQWYEEQRNHVERELRVSDPPPASPTNDPKSPSFLSQNFSMFKSPPTILPK
ncbi:uncharacterized protein LOC126855611 [Cataglyphis hispanica]|uniref:uncharacterized protein LOC126855611 n=1 Tax=Cataglyphis hispanica TaxID=1086592 RepID=UPI0021803308|nr:uncharacterized protein LOC126855611 [Cataglyphis hispanica]